MTRKKKILVAIASVLLLPILLFLAVNAYSLFNSGVIIYQQQYAKPIYRGEALVLKNHGVDNNFPDEGFEIVEREGVDIYSIGIDYGDGWVNHLFVFHNRETNQQYKTECLDRDKCNVSGKITFDPEEISFEVVDDVNIFRVEIESDFIQETTDVTYFTEKTGIKEKL